jgi:hypothetical protein
MRHEFGMQNGHRDDNNNTTYKQHFPVFFTRTTYYSQQRARPLFFQEVYHVINTSHQNQALKAQLPLAPSFYL